MDEPNDDTGNDDIGKQIEELSMLQFTIAEIATIMELDERTIKANYMMNCDRGRQKADAEVRKSIFQMAKQGSTPAQKQFMELKQRAKRKR